MPNHSEDSMEGAVGSARQKMPDDRTGVTHAVRIGGLKGYITANPHEDGTLGEVFIHGFGQTGSTNQGWVDAFAVMVSIGLQFGAEFPMLARKFAHMKFAPNGDTDNPEIPRCQSIPDYIFRWLAQHYGASDLQAELKRIDKEMAQ